MPGTFFERADSCASRLSRRRPPFWLIVVVIVLACIAPWLDPQLLAVICAVLGGLLPVLTPAVRRPIVQA